MEWEDYQTAQHRTTYSFPLIYAFAKPNNYYICLAHVGGICGFMRAVERTMWSDWVYCGGCWKSGIVSAQDWWVVQLLLLLLFVLLWTTLNVHRREHTNFPNMFMMMSDIWSGWFICDCIYWKPGIGVINRASNKQSRRV